MHKNQIIVLMGPTGSGKSALALEIAASRPTVIINMDAMQMVHTLRVLTARPTVAEEARAEHALYGVLAPHEPTSVAVWLKLAEPVIRASWAQGKLPLLVGGTGMYLQALMEGLAAVPPVPEEVRRKVRNWNTGGAAGDASPLAGEATRLSAQALSRSGEGASPAAPLTPYSLYERLVASDPLMAARLKPGDTQRILRALEVIEATGVSLSVWQQQATAPLFPEAVYKIFAILPAREEIYQRIDQRFEMMMKNGALSEVRALMALKLSPEIPIMRAHGVPELMAHLRGEISLAEAIAKSQQNTRNYVKRQMTWLRNQLPDAAVVRQAAEVLANLN